VSSDQADRDTWRETYSRRNGYATQDDVSLVFGPLAWGAAPDQVVAGDSPQQQEDDATVVLPPVTSGTAHDQVVVGNIPQRSPGFQPRPYLLGQVNRAGRGELVVQVVTGRRGVGKTQLAAEYARAKLAPGGLGQRLGHRQPAGGHGCGG
jgi:hypothetical protein